MTSTLVIADDHELLRDALAQLVTRHAAFRVAASVSEAQHAVNACRAFLPDVLVMDIDMPGRDALAALSEVRDVSPTTRIVILTAHCRDGHIELALKSQVSGFLLKTESPGAILAALRRVVEGTKVFSKAVQDRILASSASKPRMNEHKTRLASLTPREFEVLRNIARGLDNEAMAQSMSISKRTVERHVARLMNAIAIRDRTAIVKFAFQHGLGDSTTPMQQPSFAPEHAPASTSTPRVGLPNDGGRIRAS